MSNLSTLSVTPAKAIKLFAQLIERKHNFLVTGSPGCGKSEIISQACDIVHNRMILSHPVTWDPTNVSGYPKLYKDHATFVPFGDVRQAMKTRVPTLWFLDDFGHATGAVQSSLMQFLLAGECNGMALSPHTTMAMATNRRIDRAGVSGILEPVKSRFVTIVELTASLDDWCAWACQPILPSRKILNRLERLLGQRNARQSRQEMDPAYVQKTQDLAMKVTFERGNYDRALAEALANSVGNITPELIAFLRFKPELLSAFEPTADLTNSPSPRTWANASKLIRMGLDKATELVALAGAVGQTAATQLIAFLQIYRELPSLDGILMDPDHAFIPSSPSTLYAVAAGLAHKANPANFDRVCRYALRMTDANRAEFAVLMIRDACRKTPGVANTPAFVALGPTELGRIISGEV